MCHMILPDNITNPQWHSEFVVASISQAGMGNPGEVSWSEVPMSLCAAHVIGPTMTVGRRTPPQHTPPHPTQLHQTPQPPCHHTTPRTPKPTPTKPSPRMGSEFVSATAFGFLAAAEPSLPNFPRVRGTHLPRDRFGQHQQKYIKRVGEKRTTNIG